MPQEIRFKVPVPVDGVRLDIVPNEMPATALLSAQNMVYRGGRFQPRHGTSAFGAAAPNDPVRGMISFGGGTGFSTFGGSSDNLVVCGDTGWYKYAAGTWAALGGTVLSASVHALFRIFQTSGGGMLIGVNGIDPPQKWPGGVANIAALGGSPAKARALMVLANRVTLYNLATNAGYTGALGPNAFDVSEFNNPEAGWSTTLTGVLADTPGNIIGAMEMGDLQGAIYKSDAIVMQIAQGATDPFRFEWRSIGNVGPCNARCILQMQDGSHLFLGADGGVYRFDGTSVLSIGVGVQKLIRYLADNDLDKLATKAIGFYNKTRNEATFIFKERGVNAIGGILINMANYSAWPMSFGFGASDITAAGMGFVPGGTKEEPLYFYGATGASYREHDGDFTDPGSAPISCNWMYGVSDLAVPGVWKTIGDITHLFMFGSDEPEYATTGSQAVNVQVTGTDSGNIGLDTTQTFTFSSGTQPAYVTDHRVTLMQMGLYYGVTASKPFQYQGAVVSARTRGAR